MTTPRLNPSDVMADELDLPFWRACAEERFLVHRCELCGRAYWPASCCVTHGAASMRWVEASGQGIVHTFTVYHHAYDRAFVDRLPYVIAVITLDEGPFFHSDIVDCDPSAVFVEMPVEVVYERLDDAWTIPHFRPRPD
ncbi:MAG: OB-fold domain-containing protein [Acidimicrobiales bacterium]